MGFSVLGIPVNLILLVSSLCCGIYSSGRCFICWLQRDQSPAFNASRLRYALDSSRSFPCRLPRFGGLATAWSRGDTAWPCPRFTMEPDEPQTGWGATSARKLLRKWGASSITWHPSLRVCCCDELNSTSVDLLKSTDVENIVEFL